MLSFVATLDKSARFLAPKFLAIICIIISTEPLGIVGISHFMPMFGIIFIYYWSLYYPKLFPAWFVLMLGLLEDILYGMPLGISSFSNLLLFGVVLSQRRFLMREPFWVQWCCFMLFSFCICIVKWVLAVILMHEFHSTNAALMQWLLTAASYIPMHWLFSKLYMTFAGGNRYAQ